MIKQLQTTILAALIISTLTGTLRAQGFDYDWIEIEVSIKDSEIVQGETCNIEFTFEIPVGYALTSNDQFPEIKVLNDVPQFTVGKLEKPEPDFVDAVGGHYIIAVTLTMPITAAVKASPGEYDVVFGFVLQACKENEMCFIPTSPEDIQRTLKIKLVER